jgi:adenosylcobinamide kinase/adenosylcobinamide-phosphate guanylyltransferase
MGRLILIGGGASSGKTAFALGRAKEIEGRRVYLATAEARDEEMSARIRRHRAERGSEFETIEEPVEVARVLGENGEAGVVLLDCLTLWITNLLLQSDSPGPVSERIEELIATVESLPTTLIVVTNEVGLGIVPESALARTFRECTGRAHQRLAAAADEIYLSALGTMLRLRPEPLGVVAS